MNRRTSRCVALSLGLVLAGMGMVAVASTTDLPGLRSMEMYVSLWRGRVVCAACDARALRTEYCGILLRRETLASQSSWWSRFVPADHEHEWQSVGCSWRQKVRGWTVYCTMISEEDLFLETLPRFHDQTLASAVARRLLALEPEERWSEHVGSEYLAVVSALVRPREERQANEEEAYQAWRNGHPMWHDLFPPRLSELRHP